MELSLDMKDGILFGYEGWNSLDLKDGTLFGYEVRISLWI